MIQELELSGDLYINDGDLQESLASSGLRKLMLYSIDFTHWSLLDGVAASGIDTLYFLCSYGWAVEIDWMDDNGNRQDKHHNNCDRRQGPVFFKKLVRAVLENPMSRVCSLSFEFEYPDESDDLFHTSVVMIVCKSWLTC